MRKFLGVFLFVAFVSVFCVNYASAAPEYKAVQMFSNYSSASASAVYSTVVPVYGFKVKAMQAQGKVMATKAATTLDGTFLVQCGPTLTGPWVTCQTEAGTAISTTTNKTMQWSDSVYYVRGSWAKTSGRLDAWIMLGK